MHQFQGVNYKNLQENEKDFITQASEISQQMWGDGLGADSETFKKRIQNALVFVAVKNKKVLGSLSIIRLNEIDLKSEIAKTWDSITSNGRLENNNLKGDCFVCISISTKPHKNSYNLDRSIRKEKLTSEKLLAYAKSDKDPVMRFHYKPKGGYKTGAKLIKLIANGRPEDKQSLGYNVLLKYPEISKKPIFTDTKSIATHLIEAAMMKAFEKNIKHIYAYSRFSELGSRSG